MKLMKKLMMMAMMLVASAAAFAGDSPALKEILKQKSYADAEALVQSSLSQLANDAEKAKAYNKLVDLAYEAFMAQSTIQTENQIAKQMGKEEKPVDEKLMAEMAYAALVAAQECDKYDQAPNEKGKVAPKFDKKNAERLWTNIRNQLVNSGQDALQAKDNALARKYWQMFTLSDAFPFFKDCDREAQKPFFGQVARFAAIFAYQDKDMDMANKLADIAMKDPEEYENAINLKMEIMGDGLSSKEDSLNYINNLKSLYAEHKTNGIMEKLYNMLSATGEKAAAEKILDDALAADPNNFVALADKGMGLLNDNPEEASKYLKKAYDIKSDNALLATYLATSISMQAQTIEDAAKKKELYKEAIVYFDKAKELDPDRLQANWGYNRYNAYYNYYGEDADETKQAEADYKY